MHGASSEQDSSLANYRKQLDAITLDIVHAIEKRRELSEKIRDLKERLGSPVLDLSREEELVNRLVKGSSVSEKPQLRRVLREVVSLCRNVQKNVKVAVPPLMGGYCEEAATAILGSSPQIVGVDSAESALRTVNSGYADYCVVPYEGTAQGAFPATLDSLVELPLSVIGETVMGIQYHVVSSEDSAAKVKSIHGDPEAIAACRGFLLRVFPHARLIYESTLSGSRLEMRSKSASLVTSYDALQSRLHVLAENVQDQKDNAVRFILVGRKGGHISAKAKKGVRYRTSLAFTAANRPGALAGILSEFSRREINLTMIVSRPVRSKKWEYAFVVDFECTQDDKRFEEALRAARPNMTSLKLFGTYPAVSAKELGFTIGK